MLRRHLLCSLPIFLCAFAPWRENSSAETSRREDAFESRKASTAERKAFLEELARCSGETRSLRVRFRQEKQLRILRRPRRAVGDLAYADGKLSIVVKNDKGDVETRLLSRDGELKILYPTLRRLEVFPASDGQPRNTASFAQSATVPLFTGDWLRLEDEYDVTMAHLTPRQSAIDGSDESPEKWTRLSLVPRESSASVERIEIVFRDYRIHEYRQIERSRDELRMEILEWKVDAKIPEERFRLEVDSRTKIVRVGKKNAGGAK